jgi:hypothetical protein
MDRPKPLVLRWILVEKPRVSGHGLGLGGLTLSWAPAAFWWARMMVETIIWTLSWPCPISFTAASNTYTPARAQRQN